MKWVRAARRQLKLVQMPNVRTEMRTVQFQLQTKAKASYQLKNGAGALLWPTLYQDNLCNPSASINPQNTVMPSQAKSRFKAAPTKRCSMPSQRSELLWRPTTWSATAPWGHRCLPPPSSRRRPELRFLGRNPQRACRILVSPFTRGGKIWGRKTVRSEFPDFHLSMQLFPFLVICKAEGMGWGGVGEFDLSFACEKPHLEMLLTWAVFPISWRVCLISG